MEHLNLLFEADPLDPLKPAKQWNDEFQLSKQYDMFTPVLFNLDNFLDGQDIWCSQRAKKRDSPSILRCHALTDERYTKIYEALLKFSYRLITPDSYNFEWDLRSAFDKNNKDWAIPIKNQGQSFGSFGYLSTKPSLYIIRDDDSFLEHDIRGSVVIGGRPSKEFEESFIKKRDKKFTGKLFYQNIISIKKYKGVENRWRAFYFSGRLNYLQVIDSRMRALDTARPPEELVYGPYRNYYSNTLLAVDFIETEDNKWFCDRVYNGQMSIAPQGQESIKEFYSAFAKELKLSPHTPEWIWILTARVKHQNYSKKSKRFLEGTRHFKGGTKVYMAISNWDERVFVIGIPRYSESYTSIVMDLNKLEDFRLEKLYKQEIIKGFLFSWPHHNYKALLIGRGSYGNSDESREELEQELIWLNSR